MAAGISHRKRCQQLFRGGVKLLAFAGFVFIFKEETWYWFFTIDYGPVSIE